MRAFLVAALCAGFMSTSVAWAADPAEPEVTVEDSGTVLCRMVVPASEEQIRQLLEDPEATARLSPDVIDVTATPDGDCVRMETRSKGFLRPLVLSSKRCPTDDGWREVLLQQGDFTAFDGQWQLTPVEGGTLVVYSLNAGTSLPVPQTVVNQGVAKSLRNMLRNLRARL